MMPTTRSTSNAKEALSSRVDADLKKNSGRPTSKNRLQNEAEVPVQPRPVKSRGKDDTLLHVKVKELELEVRRLKKVARFPWTTTVMLTRLGIRLVLWIARR
jgi:hypothetical protein